VQDYHNLITVLAIPNGMNEILPDVQAWKPKAGFKLTRVGVTGVKKPVLISRSETGRVSNLVATFDVFVNLPETQKGSHMSRNLEAIGEIMDECVKNPARGLENVCALVARSLLEKHEYATTSEVRAMADYFLERTSPSGKRSIEVYTLIAEARAKKGGGVRKMIGVKVIGMNACPCAMETTKELMAADLGAAAAAVKGMPYITHNQRNITTLLLEVPEEAPVDADDLVDIVENSLSSPTFEILKRKDEGEVVLRAHRNPKFVEDVVRDVLRKVVETYSGLADDTIVVVRSESEESIHKHNAFAERETMLGEIRV